MKTRFKPLKTKLNNIKKEKEYQATIIKMIFKMNAILCVFS